jgi:ribosome maturation factor RimP
MSMEILERVRFLADPIVSSAGMELVEVQYRREARGWVLRLLIDKEGGVTLDDCTLISREVGRNLDVEDFISTPYTLEVSSPGLNRPLKTERDYLKYRGHLIRVKTFSPVGNRRQFKGKLLGISNREIEIQVDQEVCQIPLANVAKAHLEMDPFGDAKRSA